VLSAPLRHVGKVKRSATPSSFAPLRPAQSARAGGRTVGAKSIPSIVHDVLATPGQPLQANMQSFMGSRLSHDFSNVRVHTDARADESARAVDAAAYSVANHVVLRGGRYDPGVPRDRYLIAHELAHVAQHRPGSSVAGTLSLGRPDDPLERQAQSAATTVAEGGRAPVQGRSSGMVLRRSPEPTGIHLAESKPFGHGDLKDDALKQKFRTYIGTTSLMKVTPAGDYTGSCAKEFLTEVANTCPSRFAELRKESFCTESKCLDFGRHGTKPMGDPNTGKSVTDTPDSFIDLHRTRHDQSLLEGTGKKECSVVCHQLFKFNRKKDLGAFYIIRNFRAGSYTPPGAKAAVHITTGEVQKVAAPLAAPTPADFASKEAPDLKKKGLLGDAPPVPKPAPAPVPKDTKK
jgi:hypothetical protein